MIFKGIPKILAIIPARGGSKGLPNKNIYPLAGKPLIRHTIEAALASKYICKTVVSTDSQQIMEVCEDLCEVIKRPAILATDNAPSEPVFHHAINCLAIDGHKYDFIVALQPTSPLRDADDIDNAFQSYFLSEATALISGFEPPHSPLKSFYNDGTFLRGLINNDYPFSPRQSLPKTFIPNGAIYIVENNLFLEQQGFFTSKTIPYLMPFKKSIDIDTVEDIEACEKYLNEKKILNP